MTEALSGGPRRIRLERLVGEGFRNLAPFDLDLDAPFVVLHGANAQGKTNALEAIWYLTSLKALRTPRTRELVQWGAQELQLAGWTRTQHPSTQHPSTDRGGADGSITRHRRLSFGGSGKGSARKVWLDGKRCTDLSEYFADLRAICFEPADGAIVSEGPDLRRRWVDRAAFTARPVHLEVVRRYTRALQNKSAVLRGDADNGRGGGRRGRASVDRGVLDALDTQLAMLGARLADRRAAVLAELAPWVDAMYRTLSDADGEVTLELRTTAKGETEAQRAEALMEVFARSRDAEIRRRRTMAGPQTDEVSIRLGGRPARRYASRGQVRSLVLALKLAELKAARERGTVPLFLVDDLSSELDRVRTRRLVALLADLGAQVIATTTDPEHVDSLPASDTLRLAVQGGEIRRQAPE